MPSTNSRCLTYVTARTSVAVVSALVVACGGGGGGGGGGGNSAPPPPPATYTTGGSVSGLTGSGLVLQNNGGDNLPVPAKATTFTFSTALAKGAAYSISVLMQPSNPSQTCTVSNGAGAMPAANFNGVTIACTTNTTNTFTLGGSITTLTGTGLVLQNNGGDNLNVPAKASAFTFKTPLASGAAYSVSVLTQPTNPAQTCTVSKGSGAMPAANFNGITIACTANTYTVGGSITGLTSGGLVLQNNAGANLLVPANATSFTFPTGLLPGAAYSVTVLTQPSNPVQKCKITNGTGTVGAANVASVALNCIGVGKFVYVVNASDGDVSAFTINSDGTLTSIAGTPFLADQKPSGIVVDPSGAFVYVCNSNSSDVSNYTVDPKLGTLTLVTQTHANGGSAIAVSPSGANLFVGGYSPPNTTMFGYALNESSGVLTADPNNPYPTSNSALFGLAVDPTSQYLFVTSLDKHEVHSVAIGAPGTLLTEVANSPFNTLSSPYGVVVSPKGGSSGGFVYVADSGTQWVDGFSYDSTGNLTELTHAPWSSGLTPKGLAIDPSGSYLYVANYDDDTVSSFSIGADGTLTAIQTDNGAVLTGNLNGVPHPGPIDVKVDPAGPYVYVANYLDGSVSLFTTSSGMLTLVATYPVGSGPVAVAID